MSQPPCLALILLTLQACSQGSGQTATPSRDTEITGSEVAGKQKSAKPEQRSPVVGEPRRDAGFPPGAALLDASGSSATPLDEPGRESSEPLTGETNDAGAAAPALPVDARPMDLVPVPLADAAPEESVPPEAVELSAYLAARRYLGFTAEGETHFSGPPHVGQVRVHFNAVLQQSFAAGDEEHPVGSAAIKELFGRHGSQLPLGFAVMVKVAPGRGAETWYWYYSFEDESIIEGDSAASCMRCHNGVVDAVVTKYPLR